MEGSPCTISMAGRYDRPDNQGRGKYRKIGDFSPSFPPFPFPFPFPSPLLQYKNQYKNQLTRTVSALTRSDNERGGGEGE